MIYIKDINDADSNEDLSDEGLDISQRCDVIRLNENQISCDYSSDETIIGKKIKRKLIIIFSIFLIIII